MAQQTEEMLANGQVDEVQLGEGMSFMQRPIMEALGAQTSKRRKVADAECRLTMVTDALQVTLQRMPGGQAARRATGLHDTLEGHLRAFPTLVHDVVANLQSLLVANMLQDEDPGAGESSGDMESFVMHWWQAAAPGKHQPEQNGYAGREYFEGDDYHAGWLKGQGHRMRRDPPLTIRRSSP